MSLIKEVNESNQIIRAKAVNLLLLPFWYVAIYLFNNSFYSKSDIIITASMCIVLSLVSSFLLSLSLSEYVEYTNSVRVLGKILRWFCTCKISHYPKF